RDFVSRSLSCLICGLRYAWHTRLVAYTTLFRSRPPYGAGVGAVVANPPYLEAKRMARAEPGLRERLREAFPELKGAFDLYMAFRSEEHTSEIQSRENLVCRLLLENNRYVRMLIT